MKKSSIALGVAVAFGATAAIDVAENLAEAVAVPLTLTGAISNTSSGSSQTIISGSTATWSYETTTGVVTGTGLYQAQTQITPLLPGQIFTHNVLDPVIGGGNAASATSYSCVEGSFGSAVLANICGGYNFGADYMNDSTATWGPGTAASLTLGGDDVAVIPQQTIADYDNMTSTVGGGGTTLTVSNVVPAASGYALFFSCNTTCSPAPVLIDVNDYTGLSQLAAQAAIVFDGLTVGTINTANDNAVPVGDVISQNPTPCTGCASAGDPVALLVSLGPTPLPDQVEDLIDDVEGLGLPTGLTNALTSKLDNALDKLADGNPGNDHAAKAQLQAFINQVTAKSGKKIDPADAADLIAAAEAIIDQC